MYFCWPGVPVSPSGRSLHLLLRHLPYRLRLPPRQHHRHRGSAHPWEPLQHGINRVRHPAHDACPWRPYHRGNTGEIFPVMSSTVGIRLTPHLILRSRSSTTGQRITGISSPGTPPTGRSYNLPEYRYPESRYLWSYSPDEMGKEKPPVTIRLVLQTERLIHGGSEGRGTIDWKDIHIRWEGNDTAVVET